MIMNVVVTTQSTNVLARYKLACTYRIGLFCCLEREVYLFLKIPFAMPPSKTMINTDMTFPLLLEFVH